MAVRPTTVRRSSPLGSGFRWRLLVLVAVLAGAVYLFVSGDTGLLRLWGRWQDLQTAEQRVTDLEAQTDSLRHVLWLLENDLEYVEKVAREEYGMSRANERVYRLRPEPSPEDD